MARIDPELSGGTPTAGAPSVQQQFIAPDAATGHAGPATGGAPTDSCAPPTNGATSPRPATAGAAPAGPTRVGLTGDGPVAGSPNGEGPNGDNPNGDNPNGSGPTGGRTSGEPTSGTSAPTAAQAESSPGPSPVRNRAEDPSLRIRMDVHEIQRATIRILLLISAWLVAIWAVGAARHFLFLILLAWLVAIAAEPAIRWFVRRGRSRGLATAVVGGTSLLVLVGLFVLFGTTAFQQASQLVSQGPDVVGRVTTQLNETFGLTLDPATVVSSLQLEASDVQKLADDLGGGVLGVAGSLASILFDLITVIVFSFYIAGAGPGLVQRLAVWMPHERQLMLGELWQIATEKTGGYVASKVVLSAISSFFYGVFFYGIGLPGWLPLALLVGLTAQFVPLVGTYIGIAVPIIVALADKPIHALWIALFALVYQQIETYLFTPHVSQRTMNVIPAIALAAVFLGAAIWGPIGAIIGVPIVAVVVALVETYGPEHPLAAEIQAHGDEELAPPEPAAQRPRRSMLSRILGVKPPPRPRARGAGR